MMCNKTRDEVMELLRLSVAIVRVSVLTLVANMMLNHETCILQTYICIKKFMLPRTIRKGVVLLLIGFVFLG